MTRRTHGLVWAGALAALSICVLSVGACGGGGGDAGSSQPPVANTPPPPPPPSPPPPPPPPSLLVSTEREIRPNLTNPQLTMFLTPHLVINPRPDVTERRKLFVMLPGTGANPGTYREIVRLAPTRGYHAIGLTYPNEAAVEGLCGSNTDPDCAGKVRREVITGADTSTLGSVDAANSISGRLRSLLIYLNATFPNEGWGRYLFGGDVDWSAVVIAGHSQGGGHAGYFAKLQAFERVVMFSSPGDTGAGANSAAQWVSLPNITPASSQYGFTHTADPFFSVASVQRNWAGIGLAAFGPPVSVDTAVAPYANSRQLVTSAPPNPNPTGPTAAPAHGAPVVDSVTPRTANGDPLFAPVWIYLAFP
jgi:hypothetical protein